MIRHGEIMNLFQKGNYLLHSGLTSDFKIECDALSDKSLELGKPIKSEWV